MKFLLISTKITTYNIRSQPKQRKQHKTFNLNKNNKTKPFTYINKNINIKLLISS